MRIEEGALANGYGGFRQRQFGVEPLSNKNHDFQQEKKGVAISK